MNLELRKEIISRFGKPSNRKAVFSIVLNWLAFLSLSVLASYVFSKSFLLYVIISFLIGCTLRGFDNLTHDASHFNLFVNKRVHSYIEFLISYPVFKTLKDYRTSHMIHHRNYRKKPDKDPDTLQAKRWGILGKNIKNKNSKVLSFYIFRQLTFYYMIDNIRHSFLPHIISKESRIIRIIFWVVVLLLVALTSSWKILLLGYLIPYFYWLPYIRFVTESSKHTNVNLQEDFSNSRNNIGVLHQLLLHPHNDGYHQMHHLIASIPGYNLKKAYQFLKRHGNISSKVIESLSPIETVNQVFNQNNNENE